LLGFVLLILAPLNFRAATPDSGYRVIQTFRLGGEGGWDYVTVDPDARHVFSIGTEQNTPVR